MKTKINQTKTLRERFIDLPIVKKLEVVNIAKKHYEADLYVLAKAVKLHKQNILEEHDYKVINKHYAKTFKDLVTTGKMNITVYREEFGKSYIESIRFETAIRQQELEQELELEQLKYLGGVELC